MYNPLACSTRSSIWVAGALLALAVVPTRAQAQTSSACYVPGTGVVYRIKETGLPTTCRAPTHVEFSFSALADGSVTTVKLADGSVVTVKLADGAVTTAKLADASVTALKIAAGAVGSSQIAAGAVGSTQIAANAVGATQIANGSISTAKLAGFVEASQVALASISVPVTTPANLGSVTVVAPTSGKVLLTFSGFVVIFGDGTEVQLGIGATAGATDLALQTMGFIDGTGTLRREYPFNATAVVAVAAGTRTFFASAVRPSVFSANAANLGGMRIIALFIPD